MYIDQIPFPAITICNMNKILKSKAEEIFRLAKGDPNDNITRAAQEDVYYLDHVCSASKSFTKKFNFSVGRGEINSSFLETMNVSSDLTEVKNFLRKVSQNCSDMLPLCIWQDEIVQCVQVFRAIETDFGKCCTFNMVPQTLLHRYRNDSRDNMTEVRLWENWKIRKGGLLLKENAKVRPFPRRQMQAGKSFGLSIVLNPNLKEYYCTTSDSVGFRLQPHLSIDVPHVLDFGIGIKPNAEVFIEIRPEITFAENQIYGFHLKKRQCYYLGEFELKYYNYYSSSNCIDECIANATYKDCGCVRYYMPRDDRQNLCGPKKFGCAEDVKRNLIMTGVKDTCSICLPTCTEMQYNTELTATPLQEAFNIWETNGEDVPWANSNISIVHIYYGQDSFYARVRKELYGTVDLFANTGGLMGLCLGFSGLSFMEVIYFLTLRAWCRNRRKTYHHSTIAKKFQEIWTKTKELLQQKLHCENERSKCTSTVSMFDSEMGDVKMNNTSTTDFLSTVCVNDEFTSTSTIIAKSPDSKTNTNKIVDYKNVFGEVSRFYKNN